MTAETIALSSLVFLLIGSNILWAVITFKMADRLMSRDYSEYVYNKSSKVSSNGTQPIDDISDPVADAQARELNSIMGMV